MNTIKIHAEFMLSGNYYARAIAEDGEILNTHTCSNIGWVKYDMGIDSSKKHDVYEAKYPNGYKLELIVE